MKHLTTILAIALTATVLVSCGKKEAKVEEPIKSGNAAAGDAGYDFKISEETITFQWKVDGDNLKGKMTAKTEGWIGVGFNPTDEMKDANFVLGLVKDGKAKVFDDHGIAKRQHRRDDATGGSDDIIESSVTEKDGTTEMTFTVPLKPADSLDKAIDPNGDTILLLAWGDSDIIAKQHKVRSKWKVNLSSGTYDLLLMVEAK